MTNSTFFEKGDLADARYFSGEAWVKPLAANDEFALADVRFAKACRNNWHSHAAGQTLTILSGTCLYQEENQPPQKLVAGDSVRCKPNVRHWHGADSTGEMEHLALTGTSDSGESIDWQEPVSDAEYEKADNI